MLESMWFHYQEAAAAQARLPGAAGDDAKLIRAEIAKHLREAHAAAKDVAPYIHTRLSSVIVQGNEDGGAINHRHTGLVGVAAITQADLAKLDVGQLAALYREKIGETEVFSGEPDPDPDRTGDVQN